MHWFTEKLMFYGRNEAGAAEAGVFGYDLLVEKTLEFCRKFSSSGIGPGAVTILAGEPGLGNLAAFLALLELRCVIVPSVSTLSELLDEKASRSGGEWLLTSSGEEVKPLSGNRTPALVKSLRNEGHAGLVLFTSGTTGIPKAACFDLDGWLMKFRGGSRALRTVLLMGFDHIGGLDTLFSVFTRGGLVVFPSDKSPDSIAGLIEKHRLDFLSASPTFLNLLLLSGACGRHDLSCLRQVNYGAEPMPASLLTRLIQAFPTVRFNQTFGTTETGTLRTESAAGDSLLLRIGGSGCECRIVDGVLQIRSLSSMLGYLEHESPFTPDGWYPTGDLAVAGDDGFIRITGRVKELINVGGEKVLPCEVEDVILGLPGVAEAIVYGRKNAITGEEVACEVVPAPDADQAQIKTLIRRTCSEKLGRHKVPTRIEFVDGIDCGERFKKRRVRV
ncbi:MAG: fatty acid--CoA ligase family protein [Candidatus Wallbacteria bacterium]|nr:fatty acid--CoA ligase family protein [Candidatus Wallbacteria bacterium]